jgi:hypothetical protein
LYDYYTACTDAQRSDAQSEIRDYLASNPAFAKHVVKAGAEFVASNPGRCAVAVFGIWGVVVFS